MGFQSIVFIVTPKELKEALMPFTLFIGNAHVPINYTYTPTDVFIDNYAKVYEMLCAGNKIEPKKNNEILAYFNITTDISTIQFGNNHLYQGKEFKSYQGSDRGYAPYFSPFTFSAFTENGKIHVSTKGSWLVDYTEIMGFQLFYPKLTRAEAVCHNLTSEKDWASYSDYKLFKDFIIKHTSAFNFIMNGIEKKTQIRISPAAKEMLPNYHCVKKYNITVL